MAGSSVAFVLVLLLFPWHGQAVADCASVACADADELNLLQHRLQPVVLASKGAVQGSVCSSVGARAWLSTKAFAYIADKVFPFEVDKIDAGQLPVDPISGDAGGVKYSISNMRLNSVAAERVDFQLVENEGIRVNVSGVVAHLTMDYTLFSTNWWSKIDAKGLLAVKTAGSTYAAGFLRFSANAEGNPVTKADDVDVQVNLVELLFDAPGALGAIINAVGAAISPVLSKTAQGTILDAIVHGADRDLNSLLVGIDLGLPETVTPKACSVKVSGQHIGVEASLVDESPDAPAAATLAATPPETMEKSMFGAVLGEATANGIVDILQDRGLMRATVEKPQVPAGLPSTTSISLAGLKFNLAVGTAPKVDFVAGGLSAEFDAAFSLSATDGQDAVALVVPVKAVGSLASEGLSLSAAGEPKDFKLSSAAPADFQDKDAKYWADFFIGAANENAELLKQQLLKINSDGSKGIQISNQVMEFTDTDVTALADIKVDVRKLLESFLGKDELGELLESFLGNAEADLVSIR